MKARFITSRLMSSFVAFLFAFQQVLWGAPGFGGLSFAPKPTPVIQQEQLLGFRPVGYMTGIEITDDGWMEFAWEGAGTGQRIPISYREKMANLGFFFSALSLPEEELWVNLNVTSREGDILGKGLNFLDIGKVMLAADVELKRDVRRVFAETGIVDDVLEIAERFPNMGQDWRFAPRFWIVPGEVEIEENDRMMHIRSCSLDVKVALQEPHDKVEEQFNRLVAERIEEKVLPQLREILNTDRRYMLLRQVLYAVVVAKWYKEHAREANGRFSEYIDSGAIEGLKARPWSRRQFLNEYLRLYKLGTIDSPLDDLEVVGGGIVLSSVGNKIRSKELPAGQRLKDVVKGEINRLREKTAQKLSLAWRKPLSLLIAFLISASVFLSPISSVSANSLGALGTVYKWVQLDRHLHKVRVDIGAMENADIIDGIPRLRILHGFARVERVEKIFTDVGWIEIIYARDLEVEHNGKRIKFDIPLGLSSPYHGDRKVFIFVDSIEKYVDEQIIPALEKGKIPDWLTSIARIRSEDRDAYFEFLDLLFLPLLRREFAGKSREEIIRDITEYVVWHELGHKTRDLANENPHTENLSDLMAMFKGKAPFYGLIHIFVIQEIEPDVLVEFEEELKTPLKGFGIWDVIEWIKQSGILKLSREELAKVAFGVYLRVRKERLERAKNDFLDYIERIKSTKEFLNLSANGYALSFLWESPEIAVPYNRLRDAIDNLRKVKGKHITPDDIEEIGYSIVKDIDRKIAEIDRLLQQREIPDVDIPAKKSASADSASAGKEKIVSILSEARGEQIHKAITDIGSDLTMEVSSLPEVEEVIASVSEDYQGLGRSLYDQAYGMDVQILSFKRNGANLFAFSSRVEGMEFVGFAEEFADAKAGTPEHEAYRALVMHEAVERVQQLGGRIELAGEAELEITMPDGTREKIILSDPSAKVLARKAKKAIEAGDEGRARHYFARALVREMMPKADRVLSASIANAVGEGLRERLFNLLYDEGFEEGIFAPIVDGGGLILDEYTESLLSELEQKVRTGDVEEVIGFVREKITEQVDMADELRKEIAVILARGELSIKEKTFLVIDSLIRNNVMPDASIDSDVDGLKGNLEALYRGAVYLFKVIAVEKDEDIERMVAPDVRVDRIAKVLSARPAVSREIGPLKGKEVGGINLSSFMLAPVARW